MKLKHLLTLAGIICLAASPAALGQNLLTNGSFDADGGTLTDGSLLSGWTFTPGSSPFFYIDTPGGLIGQYQLALDASSIYYAEFMAPIGSPDTISQSVTTVAGHSYEISFEINTGDAGSVGNGSDIVVKWGGSQLLHLDSHYVTDGTGAPGAGNNGWATFDFNVTAAGTSEVLSFAGASNNYAGVANVSVTAVPEPATVSIFAFGSILGLVALRRRK